MFESGFIQGTVDTLHRGFYRVFGENPLGSVKKGANELWGAAKDVAPKDAAYLERRYEQGMSHIASLAAKNLPQKKEKSWFIRWLLSIKETSLNIVTAIFRFLTAPFGCSKH